jgi:hypothetical protein
METRVVLVLLLFAAIGCRPDVDRRKGRGIRYVEVPTKSIGLIAVNHEKGSISFTIEGEIHFFYVQAFTEASRIQATSSLLMDIQRSTTVQCASIEYGLHRRIVNLLVFYGERTIPEVLEANENE